MLDHAVATGERLCYNRTMQAARVIGFFFFALALFFMVMGAKQIYELESRLHTYQPVTVKVFDKRVVESIHHGSKSTSMVYRPAISYTYKVGSTLYSNDQVLPVNESRGDSAWAQNLLSGYTVGKTYRGYYSPNDPSQAFLLRHHSFMLYLFILFPLIHMEIGVFLMVLPIPRTLPAYSPVPVPGQEQMFELAPSLPQQKKMMTITATTLVWNAITIGALGTYALTAEFPYSWWFYPVAIVYGGVGFLLASKWIKMARGARDLEDPIVQVDANSNKMHEQIHSKIKLHAKRDIAISTLKIGLRCMRVRTTSSGKSATAKVYEHFEDCSSNLRLLAGKNYTAEHTIAVPATVSPQDAISHYPTRYDWLLVVNAQLDDAGEVKTDFPIDIQTPVSVHLPRRWGV